MKKVVLSSILFCIGIYFVILSYKPSHSGLRGTKGVDIYPIEFAIGFGVCIIGGVVLIKYIKEYLK